VALVERDELISALRDEHARAESDGGRIVLLVGESGAGKTVLTRAAFPDAVWGYCEPLSTPRPLGPFRDIAAALWSTPLPRSNALTVAGRLLAQLREGGPALIVEDAHWIDTSSADVLRFVGRRIGGTRGLVVIVAREDSTADSVLLPALGELAAATAITRLQVPALTPAAIEQLAAGRGLDAAEIARLTGGNAFLVSQLVAAGSARPGASLRESVSSRLARLAPPARDLATLLSVAPGRVNVRLLAGDLGHVDDLVAAGLVRTDDDTVEFRHELVRLTVEALVPAGQRRELHAEVLRRLTDTGAEPALMAHHARHADRPDIAVAVEVAAARRAVAFGSHAEAASHYRRAVDASRTGRSVAEEVHLLIALAQEENAIAHDEPAREAAERAVRLSRTTDDPLLRSAAANVLSRLEPSEATAREMSLLAIEYCEPMGASAELCAAYATYATNCMVARELDTAIDYARRAADMARDLRVADSEIAAANTQGSALLLKGSTAGEAHLRRAIHLAAARGQEHEVGRGYANLVSAAGEARLYGLSASAAREAMRYFTARDLDAMAFYTRGWNARCLFEQGRWDDAARELAELDAAAGKLSAITRLLALYVGARLNARRGAAFSAPVLEQADAIASLTGSLQRIAPVAAARAEVDWLAGRHTDLDRLEETYRLAVERADSWTTGELGFWLWRFDRLSELPRHAAEPFRLHVAGDFRAAAEAWTAVGCPYEAASALADSALERDLREALAGFGRLRARPAWRRTARRLRERGVRTVPREPRGDPAVDGDGLTSREVEILGWVTTGRTDADIAAKLHLSVRTVEHHVAAILRKKRVSSRRELYIRP
jgi:DNA-binding CsgD family transcriptional regulator